MWHTITVAAALMLSGACSHRYIPITASTLDQSELRWETIDLRETRWKTECVWKPAYQPYQPAKQLCRLLDELIVKLNGKPVDRDPPSRPNEEQNQDQIAEQEPSLTPPYKLQVDIRSLPEQSQTLDTVLLWLTYWFYPAHSDFWHIADVRIFDPRGRILHQKEFHALFRTYYGWGYQAYRQVQDFLDSEPTPLSPMAANSRDFYRFLGQLIADAALLTEENHRLSGHGGAP